MNSKILNNLFKGTIATTSGTVITMGFHFLSIYFLARYLSQSEFGFYALIFSISNLLNLVSNLGLEISIVKHIAEGSEKREYVLKPTLILKFFSTFFILIIYFLFYRLYPTEGFEGLWEYNYYIIILFVLGSFRDLFYRVIQGLNKFKQYSLIQISTAFLRVILIVSSIYLHYFDFVLLLTFEIGITLLAISLQYITIPFKSLIKENISRREYINLLKFSSPLYANNLITFTYDRIGVFIIGILMTASSVAIYDVSTKIPSALQGILSSYILVFFPNISTLFSTGDNHDAEKLVNRSISYYSFMLTVIIICIALWNREIINLLFSDKYFESSFPLIVMMFSLLARNLSNIIGYSIVGAGYSKIPMKVNLISVIIGISASFILVQQWNYIGAAFAALIMNSVSFIQYNFYLRKLNLVKLNASFLFQVIIATFIVVIVLLNDIQHVTVKISILLIFILLNYKKIIDIKKFVLNLKIVKSNG